MILTSAGGVLSLRVWGVQVSEAHKEKKTKAARKAELPG